MKKIILITLLTLSCSIKKITYIETWDDSEYERIEYERVSCDYVFGKTYYYHRYKREVIDCEIAK